MLNRIVGQTEQLVVNQNNWFSSPKIKAITALVIGILAMAFAPIFIKLGEKAMNPTSVILCRLLMTTIILGFVNGLQTLKRQFSDNQSKQTKSYNIKIIGLFIATGILFLVPQLLWALSLTQTSVANSALSFSFTPIFNSLGQWLLLGKRFNSKFLVGMMVAIIGSLIIGLDDWSYEKYKIQGDLLALLAALFASFYLLLIERLRDRFDAITIVQWNAIMSSIILLPIWVISGEEILAFDRGEWFTITGLALTLILSRVLIVYALKWLSSEFIAVVILLDPIFAGILAWVIFSETVDFYNLLAFPVILLGIYLATISQFDTEVPYQVN